MKNIVPVILGAAAIFCAIATGIANANGRFVGRAYLIPWLYALSGVLFATTIAIIFWPHREDKLKPLVIPLRFGPIPLQGHPYQYEGRSYRGGYEIGHHGLIVANHGEPAYDVSVSTVEIPIGASKLRFDGSKPTFTKADGDAFFIGTIEVSPHSHIMGSGLFEEMRKHQVNDIIVELVYKDAENHWYKTVGKIERNVSEPGGLSVRYVQQKRAKQRKA